MKRNKYLLAASVLAVIFPLTSQAENINVDFTATVLATTCSMSIAALDGSNLSGDATSGYTLNVGDVGLDKIIKKSAESQKNFKFVAKDCSAALTKITTTLASSTDASGNFIKTNQRQAALPPMLAWALSAKALPMKPISRPAQAHLAGLPTSAQQTKWK